EQAPTPYRAVRKGHWGQRREAFYPCAITSTRRVLRSAWTEEPSDGEPAFPRENDATPAAFETASSSHRQRVRSRNREAHTAVGARASKSSARITLSA